MATVNQIEKMVKDITSLFINEMNPLIKAMRQTSWTLTKTQTIFSCIHFLQWIDGRCENLQYATEINNIDLN